jgi:adenosylcobinamide-GDP ribazoletransferase
MPEDYNSMPDRQSFQGYFQNITSHRPQSGPNSSGFLRYQLRELVAAIRFLTILPVPGTAQLFDTYEEDAPAFIIGSAYFPLIGLLLAVLAWLFLLLTSSVFPSIVAAALLVVVQIVLTGGLHLDGLMDSCDGLFGGSTPEEKLEIMRDSRVGSFGVLGALCVLLVRFAAFASMFSVVASLRIHLLTLALFMVLPVARWGMILSVAVFPSARLTGLGSAFRRTVTRPRLLAAAITTLITVLFAAHIAGLLVLLVGTLLAIAVGGLITRQIGGLTGDSYGTIEEITEIVLLLLVILLHSWF